MMDTKVYDFVELYRDALKVTKHLFRRYVQALLPIYLLEVVYIIVQWHFGVSHDFKVIFLEVVIALLWGSAVSVAAMIVFRDRKKKNSRFDYGEVVRNLIGLSIETIVRYVLIIGGLFFFFFPGFAFGVWSSFFGWKRIYNQDKKLFHLAQSQALVRGNTFRIFLLSSPASLVVLFLIFIQVILNTHIHGFVSTPWYTLDRLFGLFFGFFVSIFLITARGLLFEKLQTVKGNVKPQSLWAPVIIALISFLLLFWLYKTGKEMKKESTTASLLSSVSITHQNPQLPQLNAQQPTEPSMYLYAKTLASFSPEQPPKYSELLGVTRREVYGPRPILVQGSATVFRFVIVFQYPQITSQRQILLKLYDPNEQLVKTQLLSDVAVVQMQKPAAGTWSYTVEAINFPKEPNNYTYSFAAAADWK